MESKGFFQLKTAADLLGKLEVDYARMQDAPLDPCPAYDFFTTARHMPDWLYADGEERAEVFENNVAMRICRHVADGAKHFEISQTRHKQVEKTSVAPGEFTEEFDARDFDVGELQIILSPADPETQIYGEKISTLLLAEEVLKILRPLAKD